MEWYSALSLILLCGGCMAQTTVTLTGPGGAVTEGTGATILFTCTLDDTAVVEMSFPLAYDATSTSENGFDHPDIDKVCCTVAAGATFGTVGVPLIDDVVVDVPINGDGGEMLVVVIDDDLGLTDSTAGGMVSVTLMDDGDAEPLKITPRNLIAKAKENPVGSRTATITLDFLDENGNLAPIEEDITVSVNKVNTMLDTATVTTDYVDITTLPITYMTGMAVTSATLEVVAVDDTDLENVETVDFALGDGTAAGDSSITAMGAPAFQIQIADDDRTELIAIQDMTPQGRHSKKDATIWAISTETAGDWDVTDSTLGHNLRDCKRQIKDVNSFKALQLTVPRPERNSKARYNEFTFTREQTFNTDMFERTVRAYLSPTSHEEEQAPIETDVDSVLVVYPDAQSCTALDQSYCISVECTDLNRRQLRWSFIPEGGSQSDEKILKKYNGKSQIRFTECDKAGLYIVGRRGRRNKGWVDFVRVIQAVCPSGQYDNAGTCAAATTTTCKNQGVIDQTLNLCTCRPGFAGTECELMVEPGTFGSNCQFQVEHYFKGNTKGKCIKFSFPDTFGVTCAAGFTGKDCCDECKPGTFGANCAQTCHCIDDCCDRVTGACANGCASGYKDFNCQ